MVLYTEDEIKFIEISDKEEWFPVYDINNKKWFVLRLKWG